MSADGDIVRDSEVYLVDADQTGRESGKLHFGGYGTDGDADLSFGHRQR
jgi:hypothetical protein